LQFAYHYNRSTDDAICQVMHAILSHLDFAGGGNVRLLFKDYCSAFNTVAPSRLATKLFDLGLNPSMCAWILDFLTARPQVVRAGGHTLHPLVLNTGVPQGCVLSPFLYSLYTHDCVSRHNSNTIVNFADDTVLVGPIGSVVSDLTTWCRDNSLMWRRPRRWWWTFAHNVAGPTPLSWYVGHLWSGWAVLKTLECTFPWIYHGVYTQILW